MEYDVENLASRLKKIIEDAGYSDLSKFSREAGFSGNDTLRNLITRRKWNPTFKTLHMISGALGVSIGYLLGETDIDNANHKEIAQDLDEECLTEAIQFVEGAYETMEINPKPEEKAEFIAFEYQNNVKRKIEFMDKKVLSIKDHKSGSGA